MSDLFRSLSGLRLPRRATMRARRSVMNEVERRHYEMLVRVRDFGDRYGHLFPATSVAQRNFSGVARAVRELEAQDIEDMAASASARAQRKIMAGEALRERLQAITGTARVLAAETPGLDQQFQMARPPP